MGTAKLVHLRATPLQVSHLCFEVDGVLGQLHTQLGASAAAFDFPAFYATLAAAPTVPGEPSRLRYDFLAIQAVVASSTMASLRAEPVKVALNKAINARQNAYFAKYGHIPAIVGRTNEWYSPSVTGSKPNRLAVLSAIAQNQADQLKAAYASDGRLGVVKTTSSVLDSVTDSTQTSVQQGSSSQTGETNEAGETLPVEEAPP